MKLSKIVEELNLDIISGKSLLDNEITGAYVSDLLSDVMANAQKGNVWVTLQIHLNIIPVASMKEIAGIIIVNGRNIEEEVQEKAGEEKIPIFGTAMDSFKVAGKLYQLGIGRNDEIV